MDLDFFDTWNFTISEKGWTNDSTALVWLKNLYSPNKADERKREEKPYYWQSQKSSDYQISV